MLRLINILMRRRFIVALIAILIAGVLATAWMVQRADRELHDDLLRNALLAAHAVDVKKMDRLPFTNDDRSLREFVEIGRQTRELSGLLRISWLPGNEYISIYSMKMREGAIYFGPESIPEDDSRASPPGTVYEEPPQELKEVFAAHRNTVIGPYTDEYGTFVSAFIPLLDADTKRLVAVLGMDIDARDWKWLTVTRAALPMTLTLVLVALMILGLARVQVATKLRESEDRFSKYLERTPDGVFMVDRTGRFIMANKAACRITGYSEDELRQMFIRDLVAEESIEEGRAHFGRVMDTGMATADIWHKCKNGSVRCLTVDALKLSETQILGFSKDITDRKRTEESLRKSEYLLRAMGSLADIGGWEFDVATLKQSWTDVVYKIHEIGSDYEPTVGKGTSFYAPESQPVIEQAVQRAIAFGESFDLELQIITAKGNRRWVHAMGQAQMSAGKASKIFGTIQDITFRKMAAEELRLAHDQQAVLVKQLEAQHTRNKILTEMREYLLASSTAAEIGPIIERSMKKLFPGSAGALFLLSASRNDLESVGRWGDFPDSLEENLLAPDECWSLRRGGPYIVEDPENDMVCSHIKDRTDAAYACLPLMAKGEVLGVLHLRERAQTESRPRLMEELKDISTTLIAVLSLAISNIKLRETLMFQSIKDPLTGLFNRRYLEETFIRETSRARRKKYPIGVIMTDIDHFKKFNDTHGHAAGDAILTEIARLLGTSLRTADIVCRYGGEEFVLVLPEASLEHTVQRAEDICKRARDLRVPFGDKMLGPVTLSMGVAGYPLHGEPLDVVLKLADLALYRAKQEGRDRVIVAEIPS